ncbi:MAG TPA: 4Fe-4S binding protein [Spirochaetota bacterium]|nr:4Fe-4S binding protein [Spirochaetota bacterium]
MKQVPVVDIDKCTRCNACVKACPVNAISVALNTVCAKCIKYCIVLPVPCQPEYISFDYNRCTSCGLCIQSCQQDAVSWADIAEAETGRQMHI